MIEGAPEVDQRLEVRGEAREREDEEERRAGDDGRHDRLLRAPDCGEPHAEGPEEELDRASEPDREPGREADVPVAPRERDEQAEQGRQVRDAHLADHLRPQRERPVDAPVPHADDPERRQRARDAQEGDRPVGRLERQCRQRADEDRRERRPDEVAAAGEVGALRRERVLAVEDELRLGVELVVEVDRERPRMRHDEHPDRDDDGEHAEGDHRPDAHGRGLHARAVPATTTRSVPSATRCARSARNATANTTAKTISTRIEAVSVAGPDAGALQPPRREGEEPDRRQPRAADGERHRRDREVVEPDDRGEDERGGEGQGEAAEPPRRGEQRRSRGERRDPSSELRAARLHHEAEDRVRVLVEAPAEAEQDAHVLVERREGQDRRSVAAPIPTERRAAA